MQESWALVAQDLDTHGIKFFLKIFEIAPPALQLFSFKGCAQGTSVRVRRTAVVDKFSSSGLRTPCVQYAISDHLLPPLVATDDADLANSPKLKKHAADVMNTVGAAV